MDSSLSKVSGLDETGTTSSKSNSGISMGADKPKLDNSNLLNRLQSFLPKMAAANQGEKEETGESVMVEKVPSS